MKPEDIDYNWISALPDNARVAVKNAMIAREFGAGESIYYQGDEAKLLAQVESGLVELSIISSQGREILVHILQPGDCFGDIGLIEESPRAQIASARGDTKLFILRKQDFQILRKRHPEINEELLKMQCRRLRMLFLLLEKSALEGLRPMLASRLLVLADMFGEKHDGVVLIRASLSQEELGKLVGASRQSINKELKYLQDKQILELTPQGILLKNTEALEQLS